MSPCDPKMMSMARASKRLVTLIAVLALAGAGIAAWLVLRDDGDQPAVALEPAASAQDRPRQKPLRLAAHNHPLVWVKRGAKVGIHTSRGGPVAKRVNARTSFGEPTVFSVVKQRGRWAAVPTPYLGNDTLGWIRLDPRRLHAGSTPYSIRIDLSDFRGELVRDQRVVRSFNVTIGAEGTETPTGRFATTDEFVGTLNSAAYGCCTLALTARQERVLSGWLGGDRIAIHGTSGPLGVAASHGCIRAADPDVRALQKAAPLGTPVIVRN